MRQLLSKEEIIELKSLLSKSKATNYLNFPEACKYLGFSKSYLYKLTFKKTVPHYKPTGRKLFFEKSELEHWIKKYKRKVNEISVSDSKEGI